MGRGEDPCMQYGLQRLLSLDAWVGGVRWMKIMRLELR